MVNMAKGNRDAMQASAGNAVRLYRTELPADRPPREHPGPPSCPRWAPDQPPRKTTGILAECVKRVQTLLSQKRPEITPPGD